jgi:hypothetical protein
MADEINKTLESFALIKSVIVVFPYGAYFKSYL